MQLSIYRHVGGFEDAYVGPLSNRSASMCPSFVKHFSHTICDIINTLSPAMLSAKIRDLKRKLSAESDASDQVKAKARSFPLRKLLGDALAWTPEYPSADWWVAPLRDATVMR